MKLIDADEAFRVLSDYYHHRTEEQHDALREALDRVPEAVVRCKDCANCRPDVNDESVWLWCRRVHGLTRKNDFCPYGESRKEWIEGILHEVERRTDEAD